MNAQALARDYLRKGKDRRRALHHVEIYLHNSWDYEPKY
jgi:hypothetical protein